MFLNVINGFCYPKYPFDPRVESDYVTVYIPAVTNHWLTDQESPKRYLIKTYRAKDLDQYRLWRITMSEHSWGKRPLTKFTERGTGKPTVQWSSRLWSWTGCYIQSVGSGRNRREREGIVMNYGSNFLPSASSPHFLSRGRHSSRQTVQGTLSREIVIHHTASSTSSSYSHPNIVLFLGIFSTSK